MLVIVLLIGASATTGALTSASLGWSITPVEENEGYHFDATFELSDEPLTWQDQSGTIIDFKNLTLELQKPITGDVHLSVDAGEYGVGTTITIIIENRGSKTAAFQGSQSLWEIDQYLDGTWTKIYPTIELLGFFETYLEPGERTVDTWNQLANGEQVDPGEYRVTIRYFIEEDRYEFTENVYFSIIDAIGSFYIEPIGDLTWTEYPVVWGDQESVFIPLPPTQTMPIGDWPTISIDEIIGRICPNIW